MPKLLPPKSQQTPSRPNGQLPASSPSDSSIPKNKSNKSDPKKKKEKSSKPQESSSKKSQDQSEPDEKEKSPPKREVAWAEPGTKLFIGANPLTVEQAKKILGWVEEGENVKFRNNFLLMDRHKKKIQCTNNNRNRPINFGKLEELVQEILRKRWEFNGEPIILGKTRIVLNGQKQLMALILAAQDVELHPELHDWKKEPTIDKLVVMGVSEVDKVVDTIDTAQPRTFSDIIFRGPYFSKVHRKFRKDLSKICQRAVDQLYRRTGVKDGTDTPKHMSLPEKAAYLNRHMKLLECVKHVYEENGSDNRLAPLIKLGDAAALNFLMGCCTSEGTMPDKSGYLDSYENSREQLLEWEMWDKAQEFWVLLAAGDKSLVAVRQALAELAENGVTINNSLKIGVLVVAWNRWANEDSVTVKSILEEIETDTDEDGNQTIANNPHCGGVDVA